MLTLHVIDGDAAVRLAVRRVLEPARFAVSEAADALGAAPARPHLIIADLSMASLAAIRRRHPAAPVLAIGSHGSDPAAAQSLAGFLAKPFTASQLLTAVRRCLARSNPTRFGATTGSRRRSARPRPPRA